MELNSGTGRRDSAAQIGTSMSPPNETQESSPTHNRRRRSSLADILREWGSGGNSNKSKSTNKLCRRETLADIAKSLPWSRQQTTSGDSSHMASLRKRRESSVDSGIKSTTSSKSRRDSAISDFKNDLAKLWNKREIIQPQPAPTIISPTPRRGEKLIILFG